LNGYQWRRHPPRRYCQIFHQLFLVDGVIVHKYSPGPTSDIVTVPIVQKALRHEVIQKNHDPPSSGHLGADKTLRRIQSEAYRAGMSVDVVVNVLYVKIANCQPPQKARYALFQWVSLGR